MADAEPTRRGSAALALLLALLVTIATVGAAGTAAAHSADPRLVTTVDAAEPVLPGGVVVEARAGIAAQLVADNPTSTPLDVLGDDGAPFLRLSAAGVQGNLTSPDFFRTSNPNGSAAGAPAGAVGAGSPRWVLLSAGSSWGWYDHRLHPRALPAPADPTRPAVLARFTVPLRYGAQEVQVSGSVRFVPLRGAFRVDPPQPLAGVTADVLQGRLPGLLLRVEDGRVVEVVGRDGEPFLRFGPVRNEVNQASRTYVEDKQARGEQVAQAGRTPRWVSLDQPSYSWLDDRLRYPSDAPPAVAERAAGPTQVGRWSVPITVDGRSAALAGALSWVPAEGAATPRAASPGSGTWWWWAGASGLLVLAGVLLLRRRRA